MDKWPISYIPRFTKQPRIEKSKQHRRESQGIPTSRHSPRPPKHPETAQIATISFLPSKNVQTASSSHPPSISSVPVPTQSPPAMDMSAIAARLGLSGSRPVVRKAAELRRLCDINFDSSVLGIVSDPALPTLFSFLMWMHL